MDINTQILFLFSALGAINGILLSAYFVFFAKEKHFSNYFLAALLFVISIRIIKSVFFYFNRDLSELFIQVGLSACILIGPFLYLYLKSNGSESSKTIKHWYLHILPFAILISIVCVIYPYREFQGLWTRYLVKSIYFQWLVYLVFSGSFIRRTIFSFFSRHKKLLDFEIWQLSIYTGVLVIWIAYSTSRYTSYIVGALSFSFVFYLMFLLWFFRRKSKSVLVNKDLKYANKKIEEKEAIVIEIQLKNIIQDKELFKNPNLKLTEVAAELNVLPHYLSQFLNDNLGKSFSLYINEYRIAEARKLLLTKENFSIEGIGYECGFNSKSTFFTTFRKVVGCTPSVYKKRNTEN